MTKTLNIIAIILITLLLLLLASILVLAIWKGDEFSMFKSGTIERTKENIVKEEKINIENLEDIKLDFVVSDMEILETEENEIRIVQYSYKKPEEKYLFDISKTNSTLTVKENKKSRFCIGFCFTNWSFFEIYIPKQYKDNLTISIVSGDLVIENNLQLDNLEIKNVSGEIVVSNEIKAKEILLKTVSGEIETGKIIGNLVIESISGDLKVKALEGKLDAKTTSGSIKLEDFLITQNSKVNSISGDVKISLNQKSNCEMQGKSISGDIDYLTSSHVFGKPPYNILKVETTSGDIEFK